MKRVLILLITCLLFIPFTSVKASDQVVVSIFYTTKDTQYNNLKDALNEINEDSAYKNKFKIVEYNLNNKEDKKIFDKLEKFYAISGNTFAYAIGYHVEFKFPEDKTEYESTNFKYFGSYSYALESIKDSIDYSIESNYSTDLIDDIKNGVFDLYLGEETTTKYHANNDLQGDDEFSAIINDLKGDKFFDTYILNKTNRYALLIIFLTFILFGRLRKSIKKNR